MKESEKTGYDLIKIIEKELKWKPSPGSIYPILNELRKGNYIKVHEAGRKKLYLITKKGIQELNKMKSQISGHVEKLSKHMSIFESLFGMKFGLGKVVPFILGELKKGRIPFGQLGKDMMKFRILFLKKAMDEKKHKKMHKVVKDAHKKLEKI